MKKFLHQITFFLLIISLIIGNYSNASAKRSADTVATYIDDQTSQWSYKTSWSSTTATLAYKGKTHSSKTIGNSATIQITGSQFTVMYTKAINKGKVNVFVDGKKIYTINQLNTRTVYKSTWTSPTLVAGKHFIKLVHYSGKLVDVDAIIVTAVKSAPVISPTSLPTETSVPTAFPTILPTETAVPTASPTILPTQTAAPTNSPTILPTETAAPTTSPTILPTETAAPTTSPTILPTETAAPTQAPIGNGHYVSADGSDTNPGTQNQPWRTIQKAVDTLTADNLVIVLAGNYAERVNINHSVTLQGQGQVVTRGFTVTADNVTIRGFEITDTANDPITGWGIYVSASNCVIENNYIHYATRGGILLFAKPGSEGLTANCIVRNNRLYRNAMTGIDVEGLNHLVENNEVWGTIQYHPLWVNPPSYVDADGIRFFGSGHIFRGNYIHDISLNDPENINPHIDAFQTWDTTGQVGSNCIFEKNRIMLNGVITTGFQLAGANNLTIRNNIISAFHGINMYKMSGAPYTAPYGITILNNTFVGSLSYPANTYPAGITVRNATNVTIKNNIIMEQSDQVIYVLNSTADVDYNLAYNSNGTTPPGVRHLHDLWGVNPLLTADFRLSAGSPAIDAGIGVPVANDFIGNIRPNQAGFDIGANEF